MNKNCEDFYELARLFYKGHVDEKMLESVHLKLSPKDVVEKVLTQFLPNIEREF